MTSLYDLLVDAQKTMTKDEFGRKVRGSVAEQREALQALEEAGGYENLED